MKFTVSIPGVILFPPHLHGWEAAATPADILRVAKRADALGFDFISMPDHVVMVKEMAANMGTRWPHPLAAIAFFAGATSRIRITTSVIVVPYHNPIELAQMISTVDFLSGGRLVCGLGVGNMKREFELLNASFDERGPVTDEYIDAMIELWTNDNPRFHGKYVHFENVAFDPKPVQKPYPPIVIGGHSKAAVRRVARVGDGWAPYGVSREQLPAMLEYLYRLPDYQRRQRPLDLHMPLFEAKIDRATHTHQPRRIVFSPDAILEDVAALKRLGVTTTAALVKPSRNVDEYIEGMEWFAQEVMPKAKK